MTTTQEQIVNALSNALERITAIEAQGLPSVMGRLSVVENLNIPAGFTDLITRIEAIERLNIQ